MVVFLRHVGDLLSSHSNLDHQSSICGYTLASGFGVPWARATLPVAPGDIDGVLCTVVEMKLVCTMRSVSSHRGTAINRLSEKQFLCLYSEDAESLGPLYACSTSSKYPA